MSLKLVRCNNQRELFEEANYRQEGYNQNPTYVGSALSRRIKSRNREHERKYENEYDEFHGTMYYARTSNMQYAEDKLLAQYPGDDNRQRRSNRDGSSGCIYVIYVTGNRQKKKETKHNNSWHHADESDCDMDDYKDDDDDDDLCKIIIAAYQSRFQLLSIDRIHHKWQWQGDGQWIDYSAEDSQLIESRYRMNQKTIFLEIEPNGNGKDNGILYQIDTALNKQYNTQTGRSRDIRREPIGKFVWQCKLRGDWKSYDDKTSAFLQSKWDRFGHKATPFKCEVNETIYMIDFKRMTQCNPHTGTERYIQRV